jgi:beta-lactamase regulating signal transducer with metallopeptidase domain
MSWVPLQTAAQISGERVLNAVPEGFLIAIFAWVLLRVLRRQNSGTRFAVWFLALLTVAALPMLGFGAGEGLMGAGTSSAMLWGSLRPAITIPGRWALFVFLAWALGASVGLLRLATGLWRLRQLRRSCTAILAADLDPAVRATVNAIVASRPVTIATSEGVRVPAAIGFWRPTIVLPEWALRELRSKDLNVILLHEFAHLRRWDDWTNLIQKIVRALFFFHPAVWWIENRLAVEREMACDDAVLAETANPHGYASCLVSLLEKSVAHRLSDKRWSMAQAAVDRARVASLRLAQILDKNRPAATRVWKPALGMAGAFSVVCLMALPFAPQFVAFDRGVTSNSDHAYSAAVSQRAFQSVPVPSGGEVPVRLERRDARRSTTHAAARVNAAPLPEQALAIRAIADQEIAPQFQTLVFVEATQYVTPGSSVWSVQVWRVTWVTQVRERLGRVQVANSI